MKTLFEGQRSDLTRDLDGARRDLEFWENEARSTHWEFAGYEAIDPRVSWNLGFHRRRIAALERALADQRLVREARA